MNGKRSVISVVWAIVAMLGATGPSVAQLEPGPAEDASSASPSETAIAAPGWPLDIPDTLIYDGVTSYDIATPKLFWYEWSGCVTPPTAVAGVANGYSETISRLPTYGGLTRTLWENDVMYPQCVDDVVSENIVVDEDYVYWVSDSYGGLVRLSTDANPGDPPELLNDVIAGPSELAQDGENVYVMGKPTGGVYRVSKATGGRETLATSPGSSPHDLQADGKFVYWISGGSLKRVARSGQIKIIFPIASGVTGYYAEGSQLSHWIIGGDPVYTEYVFIAQSGQVVRYNNIGGTTSGPIYTSTDGSASIFSLVTDPAPLGQGHVFLLESREVSCPFLCNYENVLVRLQNRSGGTASVLYTTGAGMPTITRIADHLEVDGDFVFWEVEGAVVRLPQDATELPLTNMRITGLEITQGIQDLDNSVRLIEDRRTFVRVYVESDGPAVAGVTAYLYKTSAGGAIADGPLVPVNPAGQHIKVNPPSIFYRLSLDHSFLFELPWHWTSGTLYLRAALNPNHVPPQASYANNTWTAGPFAFEASPRLQAQFVSFGYELGGVTYYPRLIDDVLHTYSWIRRTYPVASTPGFASDPSPGFRPNLWIMFVPGLGGMVDQTDPVCSLLYSDPKYRSLCASAITNSILNTLRVENGVPANVFMYGMISDAAGHFPRGQASPSANVSSGPAGIAGGWDTDGTYADWYAGHEIGHTLGRDHPWKGSQLDTGVCSQGADDGALDTSYPYVDGRLSDLTATMWGFDVGDPAFDLPIQLYPGSLWFDVMTYCGYLWVSDYTYDGMYSYMMAHPTGEASAEGTANPSRVGDYLAVYGSIAADESRAVIHRLRRLGSVASIPELVPGDANYRIRLLDGGGAVLADYGFTPERADNTPTLSFGQVVDFVYGTAEVQIVKGNLDQVLASHEVSSNPPVVGDVALHGAPQVVTATVTLAWDASDDDGDALSYDIHYSADGGATFRPVQIGVGEGNSQPAARRGFPRLLDGGSAEVDTTKLSGSASAVLRVVASDGIHIDYEDTDPFVLEDKPPEPRILQPADGTQVHYGQLVNLSGEALDAQDGTVDPESLSWSTQHGQLGTGALVSADDLPVGNNTVTLEAMNSVGLSASTSITVVVDDDLDLPGPTLSVAPSQVGWHVPAGTTADQTEDVEISNPGDGTLGWLAEADAPWLTLSATEGSAPFTLGLTAEPAGQVDGTVLSTTLWITAPASAEHVTESVAIPVSLLVGDVYQIFYNTVWDSVYLPLVLRGFGS